MEGPTGSLLRTEGEILESDLYIMEGAGTLENNARRFLETLIELKRPHPSRYSFICPKPGAS